MTTIQLLAANAGLSQDEVEQLLAMSRAKIYQSPVYQEKIASLDEDAMNTTFGTIRAAYETQLFDVVDHLRTKHNLAGNTMTPSTLTNWILGFLHNPTQLYRMIDFHENVPMDIIEAGLPRILDILDTVGEDAAEWKRALSLLALPLFAQS